VRSNSFLHKFIQYLALYGYVKGADRLVTDNEFRGERPGFELYLFSAFVLQRTRKDNENSALEGDMFSR